MTATWAGVKRGYLGRGVRRKGIAEEPNRPPPPWPMPGSPPVPTGPIKEPWGGEDPPPPDEVDLPGEAA